MITPFFGGIPATGAIARTATNIKSGAVSTFRCDSRNFCYAYIISISTFCFRYSISKHGTYFNDCCLEHSERKHFAHLIKMKTRDSLVLLITFLLTVFTSLTTAVEVGLILAVILFTKQMSDILATAKVLPDHNSDR